MTPPLFQLLGPPVPARPVILTVPHAGRFYPPDIAERSRLPIDALRGFEDRHADQLITAAVAAGYSCLVANWPRLWIDLNRDPDEIDPAMLLPRTGHAGVAPSHRARSGLGLIPSRHGGVSLWHPPFALGEVRARIERWHRPWHAAIAQMIATAQQRFERVVLLDIHSMPPLSANPGQAPARFVVGDLKGASADPALVHAATAAICAAVQPVAINKPYAGGYTLAQHGRPDAGVHAIQIECDRSLYLDRAMSEPLAGLGEVPDIIRRVADAVERAALSQTALPIAAE